MKTPNLDQVTTFLEFAALCFPLAVYALIACRDVIDGIRGLKSGKSR